MMIKLRNYASCVLVVMVAGNLPQAGAQQKEIHESDIAGAFISTVSITTIAGHLSMANHRNCLVANAQGTARLETCPVTQQTKPTVGTFTLIELTANHCLADEGNGPELKTCDSADMAQQWKTLPGTASEVKNSKTSHCLTAAGLDKPVKLEKCTGIPAQNWTLPK